MRPSASLPRFGMSLLPRPPCVVSQYHTGPPIDRGSARLGRIAHVRRERSNVASRRQAPVANRGLPQAGLDEALGFSVGLGRVGLGAQMLDLKQAQRLGVAARSEA